MQEAESPLQLVLKVASRCNLNCTYCYVYNKGDASWARRPPLMSETVFEAALARARAHCLRSRQRSITLTFHGGEPCLIGAARFRRWCERAREVLEPHTKRVKFCLQTNGTLLDAHWAQTLKNLSVDVAVSLDGPAEVNDAQRIDKRGRGSYGKVVRGIGHLAEAGIPVQILSVVQFGIDGRALHDHFAHLGVHTLNYLFPDYTHDTVEAVRARYGPTPCADFLLPILEDWVGGVTQSRVILFWDMARLVLGGDCDTDLFGNRPYGFLFVETDGAIEGLDVLRVTRPGLSDTGLSVLTHEFSAVRELSSLHRQAVFDGIRLPKGCAACPEKTTCAGGYLPHRWSQARGFDNPSIWCPDILKLFTKLREEFDVTIEETLLRRTVLRQMALEAHS